MVLDSMTKDFVLRCCCITTFILVSCHAFQVQRLPPVHRSSCAWSLKANVDFSETRQLISDGMKSFREGDVQSSVELFDQAEGSQPKGSLAPFLWQRGISYYYLDRFDEASKQFRLDVRVNPSDVEEIVWDIASQLRKNPDDFPPSNMLSLPVGAKDRRRIMPSVYKLFRGESTERELALVAQTNSSASDEFYALFYLGLFCEARGEPSKAEPYMRAAQASSYSRTSRDYMVAVSQVHCKLRGWVY